MTAPAFQAALEGLAPILEDACVRACEQIGRTQEIRNSDLRQGWVEIWKLNDGFDVDYENLSIGLHYALWYHLRNTHTLARVLAPVITEQKVPLVLYDIGCGTGATAWAAAAIVKAIQQTGVDAAQVAVVGCDTSSVMTVANYLLWSALSETIGEPIHREPPTRRIEDLEPSRDPKSERIMVCSHLLASSATKAEIATLRMQLENAGKRLDTSQVLSIAVSAKRYPTRELAAFERWSTVNREQLGIIWSDPLVKLADLRSRFFEQAFRPAQSPTWKFWDHDYAWHEPHF